MSDERFWMVGILFRGQHHLDEVDLDILAARLSVPGGQVVTDPLVRLLGIRGIVPGQAPGGRASVVLQAASRHMAWRGGVALLGLAESGLQARHGEDLWDRLKVFLTVVELPSPEDNGPDIVGP